METQRSKSGLAQAGEILLLVGAIMRTVGVLFMLVYMLIMVGLFTSIDGSPGPGAMFDAFGGMFVTMMILIVVMMVASVPVGFVGWQKARSGAYRTGGILGIVASMLPPVDVILLLGGIFLMVSDEAKAEGETRDADDPTRPGWT